MPKQDGFRSKSCSGKIFGKYQNLLNYISPFLKKKKNKYIFKACSKVWARVVAVAVADRATVALYRGFTTVTSMAPSRPAANCEM